MLSCPQPPRCIPLPDWGVPNPGINLLAEGIRVKPTRWGWIQSPCPVGTPLWVSIQRVGSLPVAPHAVEHQDHSAQAVTGGVWRAADPAERSRFVLPSRHLKRQKERKGWLGALSKAEAAPGPSKPTGSCDGAWHCSPARKENRSQSRGRTAGPPSSDFPGWDLPPATQTLPGRGNPSQPSSRKICSALPSSQQQELTAPCPKMQLKRCPLALRGCCMRVAGAAPQIRSSGPTRVITSPNLAPNPIRIPTAGMFSTFPHPGGSQGSVSTSIYSSDTAGSSLASNTLRSLARSLGSFGGHPQPGYSPVPSEFGNLVALLKQRAGKGGFAGTAFFPGCCRHTKCRWRRGDSRLREGSEMKTSDKQGADFTC